VRGRDSSSSALSRVVPEEEEEASYCLPHPVSRRIITLERKETGKNAFTKMHLSNMLSGKKGGDDYLAACLLRMRLMLRVMSLFFRLQLRLSLRIFLLAASANLVRFLDDADANWVVP